MGIEKKKIKEFRYHIVIKDDEGDDNILTPRKVLLKEEKDAMKVGKLRDIAYEDWYKNHCRKEDGYLIIKEPTMILEFNLAKIVKVEIQIEVEDNEDGKGES